MVKLAPLAPLALFASWPFLSFLGNNASEIYYYDRILYSWLGFLSVTLVTGLLAMLFCKSKGDGRIRLPYGLGVFVVVFFTYQPISDALLALGLTRDVHRLIGWVIVALVVVAMAWRLSRLAPWRHALLAAITVMMVMPLFQLASHYFVDLSAEVKAEPKLRTSGDVKNQRNVYWILTDAYERADVLRDPMGLDTTDFLSKLSARGFIVGRDSYANYPKTKLSIATTFNGDYMLPEGTDLSPSMYAPKLQGYNWTVETFRKMGYRYIHAEAGGGMLKTRCGGAEDRCITGPLRGLFNFSEAEVGLIKLTPLFPILKRSRSKKFIFSFNDALDLIPNLRVKSETPFFLFAHILSPHPPARFNNDCSRIAVPDWDMKDYRIDAYLNDVNCLNGQLLKLVDAIGEKDKTDPIIIISGDHGYTYKKVEHDDSHPTGYSEDYLRALYGILMVMRLPDEACRKRFYSSISPVNQFRLVFACLENRQPDFVPDRYYLPVDGGRVEEIKLP